MLTAYATVEMVSALLTGDGLIARADDGHLSRELAAGQWPLTRRTPEGSHIRGFRIDSIYEATETIFLQCHNSSV